MSDLGGLIISAILPVAVSSLLYYLWAKRPNSLFRSIPAPAQQAFFGIVFGTLAVLATAMGSDLDGAVLNVRIAVPMTAALVFGGPAGILSGLIGGIGRYIVGMMGIGVYTAAACSLATILSGFLGALLRKYILDGKPPAWYYGLLAGTFAEVLDMLLIILFHMSDIEVAFLFVRTCSGPMILLNGASVTLSVALIDLIANRRKKKKASLPPIAQSYQRWLALLMICGFFGTSVFTYILQTRLSEEDTTQLLSMNLQDVREDVIDDTRLAVVDRAQWLSTNLGNAQPTDMNAYLDMLARRYHVSELNIADENGIIIASNIPSLVGLDLGSSEEGAQFLDLYDGADEVIQRLRPATEDPSILRSYAGIPLSDSSILIVGIDEDLVSDELAYQIRNRTTNMHIGETGNLIIANQDNAIVSQPPGHANSTLQQAVSYGAAYPEDTLFKANVYGVESWCMYAQQSGYQFAASLPLEEAYFQRDLSFFVTVFMEIVLFVFLFLAVLILTKRLVVRNIDQINADLELITNGNLDVTVNVRSSSEFDTLSDHINETVLTLKRYIAEAEDRIRNELELARSIQMSSLQSVFPPFPQHDEFSLYALMRTAKEVGGDFYDFYLLDEDHLALIVADVSGKGIPAALFMMTAKTLIKDLAESGLPVNEIFTRANNELCVNNEQGMFVTAWMGILDLHTGVLEYANAGHMPPIVSDENGQFHEAKSHPGLVLGGMENIEYRKGEMQVHKGELLFLYTDGVTEAIDDKENMFETKRLLHTLDENSDGSPEDLCNTVLDKVDEFVKDEPQFDDITMVALRLLKEGATHIEVTPQTGNLTRVNEFAERVFKEAGVGPKESGQLSVAIDEIFSNIVLYSGATSITVSVTENSGRIIVRFTDDGNPFDPSSVSEPDVALSAQDRAIGGLGIHLVRKLMDTVRYEYRNGRNILVIEKEYRKIDN